MKKLLFLSMIMLAGIAQGAASDGWQMPKLTAEQIVKLKGLRTRIMQIDDHGKAVEALNRYVPENNGYAVEFIIQNSNEDAQVKQIAQDIENKVRELRNNERFGAIQRIRDKIQSAQTRQNIIDAMEAEHYDLADFLGTFRMYDGAKKELVKQWFDEINAKYNQFK